jgi:hypothetical protein
MTIDGRSVTEMQRKVDRRGKRSAVFRFILAKGDKDEIIAWNQELFRILHVFNVRSIGSVGGSANLVALFQTELTIDTNLRVADAQAMVADTKTAVVNAQTMVADMHRNMFMGQKSTYDHNHSASATRCPSTTECSQLRRLKPGQRYRIPWGP